MNGNFIEKFDKSERIRGGILALVYIFTVIFGVNILELMKIPFLVENATFVWYCILFLITVVFFLDTIKESIINIKSKKKFF